MKVDMISYVLLVALVVHAYTDLSREALHPRTCEVVVLCGESEFPAVYMCILIVFSHGRFVA